MRDPYDILGVPRGASFEEIRAAYRRACKARHPDMGGCHGEMVELNTAYAAILSDLKRSGSTAGARDEQRWKRTYRDIDDELEELRREAERQEARQRAMRADAWASGDRTAWAKLTWDDVIRFIRGIARSGLKGVALLFAALVGVGTVLVEANVVSTLVIFGSGIGFFISLALKSDKGGFMSAGLLLFGIATTWMPSLRAALFNWPVATVSVLLCLAVVFKFSRDGGIAGLLTGGILAICLIGVILNDTLERQSQTATSSRSSPSASAGTAPSGTPLSSRSKTSAIAKPAQTVSTPSTAPPEPRELLAAQGSILKFADGVAYQLKLRSGMRTQLVATTGAIAFYRGGDRVSDCTPSVQVAAPTASGPYVKFDRLIRSCAGDAIFQVSQVW